MSAADNASDEGPPRVGLVADEEQGPTLVRLLSSSPNWHLVATSGAALEVPADVEWFDDRRVMITQSKLDALVLATSTRAAIDLDETAGTYGLSVWRTPPLARNFAEATQLVTAVEQRPRVYRVMSWWDHVRAPIREALQTLDDFKPRYTDIVVAASGPSIHSWRAGTIDAGGGVMTLDAYPMLEALIAMRGLPDNVSATTGRFRRHPGEAARETEDVALAVFRYEGGGVVSVRASWDIHPHEQYTLHHGAAHTVKITPHAISITDLDGEMLVERPFATDMLDADLAQFARSLTGRPAREAATKTLHRHVAVAALLETIYLSARTWHPEVPRKLYEVQGWRE